jgi:hypothetical protein
VSRPFFYPVGDIRSRDHIVATGYPVDDDSDPHPLFCDCDGCLNRGGGLVLSAAGVVGVTTPAEPGAAPVAIEKMRAEARACYRRSKLREAARS